MPHEQKISSSHMQSPVLYHDSALAGLCIMSSRNST